MSDIIEKKVEEMTCYKGHALDLNPILLSIDYAML